MTKEEWYGFPDNGVKCSDYPMDFPSNAVRAAWLAIENKQPYPCETCGGAAIYDYKLTNEYGSWTETKACHACEGKGVKWA